MSLFPVRIAEEDRIRARIFSSVTNVMIARFRMSRDREGADLLRDPVIQNVEDVTADRTQQDTTFSIPEGWLQGGHVVQSTAGVKRGQALLDLHIFQRGNVALPLFEGYVYQGFRFPFGMFVEPGPGGGEGHQHLLTLADDVAGNVDTTMQIAAVNAIRKWYGFIVYYHASSDVATRQEKGLVRALGGAPPTGFTAGSNEDQLSVTGTTLTADEEGNWGAVAFDGKDGYSWLNDDGTLQYIASSTNPIIFPLWVTEDDLVELVIDVTNGHANDRYSAYAFIEEWIQP